MFLGGCIGDWEGVKELVSEKVDSWVKGIEDQLKASRGCLYSAYCALNRSISPEKMYLQQLISRHGRNLPPALHKQPHTCMFKCVWVCTCTIAVTDAECPVERGVRIREAGWGMAEFTWKEKYTWCAKLPVEIIVVKHYQTRYRLGAYYYIVPPPPS